jgi:hypothetical protein
MRTNCLHAFLIIILSTYAFAVKAQIGGSKSFYFVNMPGNAPLNAIGGINVSAKTLYTIQQNPALISKDFNKQFSISNTLYLAGINSTNLQYVHDMGKYGPLGVGMQYYSSGSMDKTDDRGNNIGTYSANQYALTAATSHTMGYYTLGLALKFAGMHIDGYNGFAGMVDVGGLFKHPSRDFTVGLVFKNMGYVFNQFADAKTQLPFDVQLGTSYKLEHMPFRLSVLAHHLHIFDIVYLDPNKKLPLDANGNPIEQKKTIGDKILRHFVLGGEFFLGKFLSLKVGYNHLVRREMRLEDKGSGLAGFSFGILMSVKSFEISYARDWQHIAGGFDTFTLKSDLSKLIGKKQQTPPSYN